MLRMGLILAMSVICSVTDAYSLVTLWSVRSHFLLSLVALGSVCGCSVVCLVALVSLCSLCGQSVLILLPVFGHCVVNLCSLCGFFVQSFPTFTLSGHSRPHVLLFTQVEKILEKHDPLRVARGRRLGPIPGDEASAVQNYVEHMLFLLMEEGGGPGGAMGPILELVVTENVMERLFIWSLQCEFTDDMKLEQLRTYEMLVRRCRQPLLRHKPVLRPLMMLLAACSGPGAAAAVEAQLLLLLGRICSILAREPSILELFFHASEDQGAANFLIFSLLIPFTHREGTVGRQAREALLFIVALSAKNRLVARYIAENTYFCPVSVPCCPPQADLLLQPEC